MKIFRTVQSSVPAGCSGMTQYVNETDRPIQVNSTGDYIRGGEVVVCFENSHIQRALRNSWLGVYDFSSPENESASAEPKGGKKYKKAETAAEVAEPEAEEVVATEEDSVVAIETTDI
jgi:hypothetical protein